MGCPWWDDGMPSVGHLQSCCHTPPAPATSPPILFGIFPNHPNPLQNLRGPTRSPFLRSGTAAPLPDVPSPCAAFQGSILSPLTNLFLWLHHKNSSALGSGPGIFAYVYPSFSQHSLAARWENRRSLQHFIRDSAAFLCREPRRKRGGFPTLGHFHRDQGKGEGKPHGIN